MNTDGELRGETGWPPALARAVALMVLAGVNVVAGVFLGFATGDALVGGTLAAAVCVGEVVVLWLMARRRDEALAWGVVALFTLTLAGAGWLGVSVGAALAHAAEC
ncbi:MAG TPA: hypothetical protein VFF65_11560 [Phycisphaerales bacterium]|nr:hypothetical protein [Phycisphaerales bacterium]